MYDVITVGSAILDIILKSSALKVTRSDRYSSGRAICEAYGGKIEADEIVISSGGGGTNNAVSFARKGLKVGVVSEMGDDVAGKMIRAELASEHVDADYLVVEEGEETGISVILVAGEGGRSVVTYRGASKMLTRKDIPWKKLNTKWLYVSSLGGRLSLLEDLCSFAKENKIKIAVNPGGKEIINRERVLRCVEGVNVLILNQEEAKQLTGLNYLDMKVFKSKERLSGAKVNIITAGRLGGKVCTDSNCIFYTGSKIKKVSSLGAGDAFGSGFISALIFGKDLGTAVEWGKRNAESVLKYLSAKKGLLSFSEIAL